MATGDVAAEANKEVVRRLYDSINRRDLDATRALLSDDYVHHSGGQEMSWDTLSAMLQAGFAAFSDSVQTVDQLVAENGLVAAFWTARATHSGEGFGRSPTGKRLEWWGVNLFRVEDGKIREDTPYWDFAQIERQLADG